MNRCLWAFCALITLKLSAQTTYNKFQWQSTPQIHAIDKSYQDAGAVYVTDDRIVEYLMEKEGLFMYRTMHKIIHINSDKGIETFNKIYLPMNEGMDMPEVKARTILPDGKIIELGKENIKDLKDEDGQFKIFALEGLVKGAEVEYYFTIKKPVSFFGREIMSSAIPAIKTHFELISPDHLFFETKSYNNLPQAHDTVINEKRYVVIDDSKVTEAEEEKYSMYNASLKRVEYKLSYNKAKDVKLRLFTWDELAKRIYEIYTHTNEKDNKKIASLLNDIAIKSTTDVAKAIEIENYMKKNFITREDISENDADDLGTVIKNKVASHLALCKLYLALLKLENVDCQIVYTGDRSDYTIDRSFENWNNTRNVLIYFPSTKKYMAPTEIEYRYPWIPPTWAATNGLYCVTTTIGNFTTAIGEVRAINMESSDRTYLNMDINLKMDKDESLLIDVKQTYAGYAAPNYRAAFVFSSVDDQEKILKELVKFGTNSENILSHTLENKEMDQPDPYKPFILSASVKSTTLTERAGNKILFKIGELIGQQVELYNVKERKTEVDIGFAHTLNRNIEFIIPDGYTVKNLDDLKFDQVYKENDKEIMGFTCTYQQKGNVLKVNIKEDYFKINYPVSQYDNFKKVINASADFNKVVLVLEKAG